jgi:DUF1680 family protein
MPLRAALLKPTGFRSVSFAPDSHLGRWQSVTHHATIPHLLAELEKCGAVENLRQVRDGGSAPFQGLWFADSDVYKVLEAVAWDAGRTGSRAHVSFIDDMVDLLQDVQLDDGYINSWFQRIEPARRWKDLGRGHEMYCAGHLIQAGIAAARALDRFDLLDIGRRFADHLVRRFGAGAEPGLCGHPEIETALIELYRQTGVEEYLDLARLMIDRRGHGLLGDDEFGVQYFQDHVPVREATEVTGHAVRQLYLTTGATDVYLETGDTTLLEAMDTLWHSAYDTKTYVTGGHGSRHRDEAFGDPFELPADRAYAETCAAIASFQWNWRMLLATGEGRFADAMEWTLLNAIAASTTTDGTAFFYSNPLQLRSGHDGRNEDAPSRRLPWYKVPCCPPNLGRLVSTLSSYALSSSDAGVQLHLYNSGEYRAPLDNGKDVAFRVTTDYPWEGTVRIDVTEAPVDIAPWSISFRRPEWASDFTIHVNGEATLGNDRNGYMRLRRHWVAGDVVVVEFPIATRILEPHPQIDAARGSVCVTRGPLVYCLDDAGQPFEGSIEDVQIDPSFLPAPADPASPGGAIRAAGTLVERPDSLYRVAGETTLAKTPVDLVLVPYFSWGNEDSSAMRVWIPATS